VGGSRSLALLEASLADTDQRVRQTALTAIAAIQGDGAVPRIIQLSKRDPLLTVDAINLLGRRGTRPALDYLRELAERHPNRVLRKRSAEAARKVSKRLRRDR